MANPFFTNQPVRPHLVRPGGLKGEVDSLGKSLQTSFDNLNAYLATIVAGESGVLWAPGGGGTATTWAQVYTQIQSAKAPTTIYFMASAPGVPGVIPAGTYDLKGATLSALKTGDPQATIISMDPGAVLRNLYSVKNALVLECHPQAADCFEYDLAGPSDVPVMIVERGAVLKNSGIAPALTVDGSFAALSMYENGAIDPGTAPVVKCKNGGTLLLYFISSAFGFLDSGALVDDGTGNLKIVHDGEANFTSPLPFPGFTNPVGTANWPVGINGGAGPSALIPVATGPTGAPVLPGCTYFDTTLETLLTYDGMDWMPSKYNSTFVNGDLAAGVLTVTHNMHQQYGSVTIYDDSDKVVVPDSVTATGVDTVDVDLTTKVPLAGTWKVVVR